MTLEYTQDLVVGRRLVCPEPLGGCGALCDADVDGQYTDWTCPMCGQEWNVHDAENDLDQLEEDAG